MKSFLLFTISVLCFFQIAFSQKKDNTYFTSGGELIFSFADVDYLGASKGTNLRFSPFFNVQTAYNIDMSDNVGFFTGLSIRNVGYILPNYRNPLQPLSNFKKKFRSYNLGLPVGFKVGNLNRVFFFAGYEIELPIHYKEKTFDGGDRINKTSGWFSNRQQLFQHGAFAGFQFPYGLSLKFKYYFSEFHNQDFVDGIGTKPYAGLKANIFYFSLSSFLLRDFKYSTSQPAKSTKAMALNY